MLFFVVALNRYLYLLISFHQLLIILAYDLFFHLNNQLTIEDQFEEYKKDSGPYIMGIDLARGEDEVGYFVEEYEKESGDE